MVVEKIIQIAFPGEFVDVYNDAYLDVLTSFIKEGVDNGRLKKKEGQNV